MLIEFSVSNFRSFRERQTLSLVASRRQKDHADHLVPIPGTDHSVLPVAAIYGANAAGKSNLVRAIAALRDLVIGTNHPNALPARPRDPFAFGTTIGSEPTEFEARFLVGEHQLVYGVRLLEGPATAAEPGVHVVAEWLDRVHGDTSENVFERRAEAGRTVVEIGPAGAATGESWRATLEKLGSIFDVPGQTFVAAAHGFAGAQDLGPLRELVETLQVLRVVVPASRLITKNHLLRHASFRDACSRFLESVGTGISEVTPAGRLLSDDEVSRLPVARRDMIQRLPPGGAWSDPAGSGDYVRRPDGGIEHIRTFARHRGGMLPLEEESDGTRRLLDLLPMSGAGMNGSVTGVVDELDRSLHPLLARHFVRTMLRTAAQRRSQILFTTHETSLLDLGLLRRDEIWFARKDPETEETDLYSLADFATRKDLRVGKAYLEGRYDAVPPVELDDPAWLAAALAEADIPTRAVAED